MPQVFSIQGCEIQVSFREHSVHIVNDRSLWKLMDADHTGNARLLVEQIFLHFEQQYGRKFEIHPDSLVVEIWGHVYCEYFTLVMENMIALKLVELIADKIISYCEMIDCGEKGFDHNRALWDMLAPFHAIIADWLPEHIHNRQLKD